MSRSHLGMSVGTGDAWACKAYKHTECNIGLNN